MEAERFNYDHIAPEHLVLGLIKVGSGVAAEVLRKMNIDLEKIRSETEAIINGPPDAVVMGQLPFTLGAKKVLEFAIDEARAFQHDYIGTEHLLLGLIRLKDSRAAEVMASQRLRYDDVRQKIIETLATMPTRPAVVMEPVDPQYRREEPRRVAPARTNAGHFDRFTDRARNIMTFARREAIRFNHDFIGTEHILLGLIIEGSGVAANVLEDLDVDLEKTKKEVESRLKPLPQADLADKQLPFTPRGKRVLEFAIDEARGLGHNYVGSEHVLLGLLREGEGTGGQVLMDPVIRGKPEGLTLEMARDELRRFLGETGGKET
jgi:ATP-dependent Clp protease ATP-binding subunit ClpA